MPFSEGKIIRGWGVVRDKPWRFGGVFPSRGEAQRVADRLGIGFAVREGENRVGTPFFLVDRQSVRFAR